MRLYLKLYLALLGSVFALAGAAAFMWHVHFGVPLPRHSPPSGIAVLLILATAIALAAFPVVRSLTRRLERLQRAAEALAAGDLKVRVPVEGSDEVATLAAKFNHAAALIEQLVGAHKLFLAQASHELRTPLTRIRLGLDLAKDIDPGRRRELERDIAELDDLVEEILLASRLDTLSQLEHREAVDLLALVAEECARYDAVDLDGEPAQLQGDPRLLRRMVRNLLENARRHGRPPVRVRVRSRDGQIELLVSDAGEEIPESAHENLFTPFQRGADGSGHGLGLSLVRQIARQHGGDARYGRPASGPQGFIVTLRDK
jgi:signal transduction histidine kinase